MPAQPPERTPAEPPGQTSTQLPADAPTPAPVELGSATARTAGATSPHTSAQTPVQTAARTSAEKKAERAARRRATCRAVGQIALVLALAARLVSHAQDVIRCASADENNREVCRWLFTPPALGFTLIGVVSTALAALGLWATLRHSVVRVWIVRACAIVLAAPAPVWLVWSLLAEHDSDTGWAMRLVGSLINMAPVVPLMLLLASYRGRPTFTQESGLLGWLSIMLGPLILLILGVEALAQTVDLPLVSPLVELLGAGLLYGLMRRRRPAPGSGHWLPATLILTALLIPNYTWLRWGDRLAEQVPGQVARDTIAWALTVITVAVLAGMQLATRRNHPRTDDGSAHATAGS